MRFVFITLGYHPDSDGGGYRYAAALAEELAARDHSVVVITPRVSQEHPATEELNSVTLYRVGLGRRGPKGRIPFWSNWWRRNRAVRHSLTSIQQDATREPPWDVLISHHTYFGWATRAWEHLGIYQGPWALEHAYSSRTAQSGWLHRSIHRCLSDWMHRRDRRALCQMKGCLVASEYTRKSLPRWHPGIAQDIRIIGGGVDCHRFRVPEDREALRLKWGLAPGDFLGLAVRRLDGRMGLDRLIRAFADGAQTHPRAKLWLAGRGPQREWLESLCQELGVASRVRFLGFVPEEDLPELYAVADCSVMPSLDLEGFGLATVESLACGTPVLASDAGANPELLRELSPDLIYPVNQEGALSKILEQVLSGNCPLPTRQMCRSWAESRYTWGLVADRVERIGKEFGSGKSGVSAA